MRELLPRFPHHPEVPMNTRVLLLGMLGALPLVPFGTALTAQRESGPTGPTPANSVAALSAALDEWLDVKGFEARTTLKEFLARFQGALRAKGKEVSIVVSWRTFYEERPD